MPHQQKLGFIKNSLSVLSEDLAVKSKLLKMSSNLVNRLSYKKPTSVSSLWSWSKELTGLSVSSTINLVVNLPSAVCASLLTDFTCMFTTSSSLQIPVVSFRKLFAKYTLYILTYKARENAILVISKIYEKMPTQNTITDLIMGILE